MQSKDKDKIIGQTAHDTFYETYWQVRGRMKMKPRYYIFASWIKSGSKILDIGGGDGVFGEYLHDTLNCDIVCLDISHKALEMARQRGLKTVQADATKRLPFDDNEFDYTISSEFIEHIPNSEDALAEAMRVSREHFLVSFPNAAYWRYRFQMLSGRTPKQWEKHPAEHLRFWAIPDFIEWVDMNGFEVKEYKASNGRKYLRDFWPNLFGFQMCYKVGQK
ncbi:MAG TPA: methionine biosynthesis protein MetW [Candidatus Paceibacterota bacterium]|nr:methionine biosynthesis protein MetW [Candidatus Paceibacterota bacterium]